MRIRRINIAGAFIGLMLLSLSCKKDRSGSKGALGSGNVYFTWADEGTLKINLQSGAKSLVLPNDTKQNGFDVSKDQKRILVQEDVPGQYDTQRFKILDLNNGTVISSMDFTSTETYTNPRLSPNGTLILCSPLLPGSVTILNIVTQKFTTIKDIQGKSLTNACWMPDETILLSTANALYRSNKTFDQVSLIKNMDFSSWGSVAVRNDGKKIAFAGDKHIWMMDANADNLMQITDSNSEEGAVCFSPDGSFMIVGTYNFASGGGPWAKYYTMFIVPADGKKYQMDSSDSNVKPVIAHGESSPQSYDSKVQWL
ncbi:hypothetical protein FW774_03700 (plasmid) [Pedobacter sp. BS3]|uniref:hypothetical protein n=1 Tax=Pedobacter sp. BS3 TaxID=2567937 RepID=UPI0011EDF083|nr:hypothetical protein [Pedobacter sp. BS3]TZF86164.1 hypothetical protein FW774_03700 [Pedobacter sp. BS3]